MEEKRKYNYTKKTGRPTKYKPEYCQQLIDYFSQEPFKLVTTTKISNKGNEIQVTEKEPQKLPMFHVFAHKIGVEESTLLEWVKKHDEFSKAYAYARHKQQENIVNGGLSGAYNPRFCQFVAINYTKMQDKKVVEDTSKEKFLDIIKQGLEERRKLDNKSTINDAKVINTTVDSTPVEE